MIFFKHKEKPTLRILLIMKLSVVLLMACLINATASVYSQNARISLNCEGVTLDKALSKIEESSEFVFFYRHGTIDNNLKVSVHAQEQNIDDVLKSMFKNTDIGYSVRDRLIVLGPKEEVASSPLVQAITITGTITDEAGMAMPGANVAVKGTTTGVITDMEGKYSINIPNRDAVLLFSFIGYATQELPVGSRTSLNVVLIEESSQIEEVVVTALGIKRQTKALSYSATEVKGEDLEKTAEVNVMNSLSGKIAGVNISMPGTGITGSSQVLIRGNASLSRDNNPLYIIDGMQVNRASFSRNSRDYGDVLNTINSDDIESISVLKGAGATALYGSQAANGVVLITTKKGGKKAGLGVTYSGSFGLEQYVSPFKNRQKEYGVGVEGKKLPDAGYTWSYNAHQEWGAKYDGSQAFYPDGTTEIPWGYSYHGDPWDTFMRNGLFMNNAFAFSGGGDKQTYRFSVSDMRQQSPIPNSNMNRQTMSLNASTMLGKRLQVDTRLDYSTMYTKNRPNTQSYVWTLGHMASLWDIEYFKGTTSKIGAQEDGKMLPWSSNEYYHNPYWASYQNEANDRRDRVNGLISGKLDITDWLYLTGRIGTDFNATKARYVEAYGAAQFANGTGQVEEYTTEYVRWNADYSIVFNKNLGDFNVNAMFGGAYTQSSMNKDGVTGTKLTIPYWEEVVNGSVQATNVDYNKTQMNSLYGSAELSYRNMVYLTFTGRNDWFSSLAPGNNSIFYPSVGLSYIFSQQFQMPSWVSFGKVRGSYAKVGGGADAYMTKFRYDINALGYMGYPTISLPGTLPNPTLMPFDAAEWEVGIDLRFFNNRFSVDYAYYDRKTTNDILNVSRPASSGYGTSTVNLGEMSNKGHEIALSVVPIEGTLTWNMTFTYTYNKSEVLNLGGATELQTTSSDAGTTIKQIVGQPFNSIVGYRQDVDPASGQPIWEWNSSRAKWAPKRTAAAEILGTGINPHMASVSTTLSYKGIVLDAMVDAKWGAKVFSSTEYDMTARGHSKRTAEYRETGIPVSGVYKNSAGNLVALDHDTTIPYTGNNFEDYYRYGFGDLISDYNVFDASYVMLRQLSLGYTLPKTLIRNWPVQNVRFSLVGRNLWSLYNKIPNGDASTLNNVGTTTGIERYILPRVRSYAFNINLAF